MTSESEVFVGIDVSKETLDVAIYDHEMSWQCRHDDVAIGELIDRLVPMSPQLIVLEATGGLEIDVTVTMIEAGLPVAVVNPTRVREFAKAIGQYAKTDRIDAQLIAHFACKIRPDKATWKSQEQNLLSALIRRRQQVIQAITAEKNRLGTTHERLRERV